MPRTVTVGRDPRGHGWKRLGQAESVQKVEGGWKEPADTPLGHLCLLRRQPGENCWGTYCLWECCAPGLLLCTSSISARPRARLRGNKGLHEMAFALFLGIRTLIQGGGRIRTRISSLAGAHHGRALVPSAARFSEPDSQENQDREPQEEGSLECQVSFSCHFCQFSLWL